MRKWGSKGFDREQDDFSFCIWAHIYAKLKLNANNVSLAA